MRRTATALALTLLAPFAMAEGDGPISAIDWLSHSIATPRSPNVSGPVSGGIATEQIQVRPLDVPSPDGVGLLPRSVTGLPPDLWGDTDLDRLVRMISDFPVMPLPAVQDQFRRLMLAELDPPNGSTPKGPLLQARIDALLARGAVDEAEALLERTGANEPELFRRAFDVGLLTGREQAACARMRAVPGLSPSFPVRIFCLARTGDWPAAAVTLDSAKALGALTPAEDALLAQFLDAELAEFLPPVAVPARPSPLTFRMMEAIGEPIPTAPLPLAFAHSDLRPIVGWRARVEAAERLARAGSLPPNVLIAIYGESQPAASGGVWERVAAVQSLIAALESGDADTIAAELPPTWQAMLAAGLAVPLARAVGDRLTQVRPDDPATAALVDRIRLLSDGYEAAALDIDPAGPLGNAAAIARGLAPAEPQDDFEAAIAAAFADPAPELPHHLAEPLAGNRRGEALLMALRTLADGKDADYDDITAALALLRRVGLEDTARRASLQMLLLERSR